MHNDHYPPGEILSLLNTRHLTQKTADVLRERLQKKERISPAFFNDDQFEILTAVCNRLFPQQNESKWIYLAEMAEESIATSAGKGWRYDALPPVKEMFRQGIDAVEAEAQQRHNNSFVKLSLEQQDILLLAIQKSETTSDGWNGLPSALFFTELLATCTEMWYSHPFAKDEIGDASFADLPDWQRIGLNEHDGHEPPPQNTVTDAG